MCVTELLFVCVFFSFERTEYKTSKCKSAVRSVEFPYSNGYGNEFESNVITTCKLVILIIPNCCLIATFLSEMIQINLKRKIADFEIEPAKWRLHFIYIVKVRIEITLQTLKFPYVL